ncbi:MAG: radical SAM family heme chaperone HemW [Desulfobacterales bacterium]|nr:MAG: radical SAM family heme chaperone HemW [Desulfobacterales bacterium]
MFAGLYIHIPFCLNKCPYCDFYSITDTSLHAVFLDALITEMQLIDHEGLHFDTLYVGGGTPSVLDVTSMERIIEFAHQSYPIDIASEITVEVNPGTVTLEQLKVYRRIGINRINIGIQSFHSNNLRFLQRSHSVSDINQTITWAVKAGFEKLGLDLIYGIPGQTTTSWLSDLQQAVASEPQHISCYSLIFEPGTPLDDGRLKGYVVPLSDENICNLYETARTFLTDKGYVQYEISNFAYTYGIESQPLNPEHNQSRHNLKYWSFAPYIGLGPSANSFIEPKRFWNHSSIEKYLADLADKRRPIEGIETLSQEQMMIEAIYLGLRQTKGISIDVFNSMFGQNFHARFKDTIEDLAEKGLVKCSQSHCALTPKGMLLLDSVVAVFT